MKDCTWDFNKEAFSLIGTLNKQVLQQRDIVEVFSLFLEVLKIQREQKESPF